MSHLQDMPVIASFVAGLFTFVSPCVLPLMPAYLSFITGHSIKELQGEGSSGKHTIMHAVFFVLGFSFIFVLLGASATWLGNILFQERDIIRWVGGIVVIIFGLHVAHIVKIPFLYYEKRMEVRKSTIGLFHAFLMGNAFSLGWTPCIGPILSSILVLASTEQTVSRGILLLTSYSLGLGIPFILTAVFIHRALKIFSGIRKYYQAIEIASGSILIILGLVLLTDNMGRLSAFLGSVLSR